MSNFNSVDAILSNFENLAIRDASPLNILEKIFNDICSKYFVMSKSCKRRKIVDREVGAEETIDLKNLGQVFPFVNREEESKQLVRCFGYMDLIRGRNSFDKNKRRIGVPLCVGLPGLGKTRYVRIALTSLIKSLTDIPFPAMEDMLMKADELARIIWGDDRTHDELLIELIMASHEDRNIRITLNCTPGTTMRELEIEILSSVLVQWMKHRQLKPEFEHLQNDEIVSLLDSEFGTLRKKCLRSDINLTLGDTVDFILQQDSQVHETGHSPALIINLDEAQKLGILLQYAMEILVKPILTQNSRVFITITGISKAHLFEAIQRSDVSVHVIILPVLTDSHIASILAKVFEIDIDAIPRSVRNAVKWLGGVPRFLEYFLDSIAEKSRSITVPALWKWLCDADLNSLMDVISMTRPKVTGYGHESGLPDDLLDNIFSLAIAGHPIKLDQRLIHGTNMWTVEDAQNRSLLYWNGAPGGCGTVIMPPLLLHHIHLNSAKNAGASIHPLKRPSAFMSSDDNEALAVSALLHKLKAASIGGTTQVFLYKDLMGGMKIEGVADVIVTVPQCFNLEVLDKRIGVKEFARKKREVLENIRTDPTTTPIAFVNGRGASFADAFIILPGIAIFIQEKQSVIARRRNVTERTKNIPFCHTSVVNERLKVSKVMERNDLFVYVTDDQDGGAPSSMANDTLVVTAERHNQLFGSTLAWLRASALENSAIRADSKNLVFLGNSPAEKSKKCSIS
jgi:hypothetical protein